MGLKNWPLYGKLGLGFGIVLLFLALIIGAMYKNVKSTISGIQKVEKISSLEKSMIQRENDHLKFIDKATQFFLDPAMSFMAVQTDDHKCQLGTWLFGEGRRQAEGEIPKLVPVLKGLENSHSLLHSSIIEINNIAKGGNKEAILPEARSVFAAKTKQALIQVQDGLQNVERMLSQHAKIINGELSSKTSSSIRTIFLLAGAALLVVVVTCWMITRSISGTIKTIVDANEKMSDGDMQVRIKLDQNDEMGTLAKAANVLAQRLELMFTKVRGSSSTISTSTGILDKLAGEMTDASRNMASNCNNVAVAAEEMNTNMTAIAAASEETSTNISMVAAAAEELTATITEIAANAENAKEITGTAVAEATTASESIHELGEAANDINKVTETINEIAEQTNLLALNATIEAARAGEAGKGFAVVANEIKDLASQTTDATREIKNRVDGVQTSSEKTIFAINTITSTIHNSSEVVNTMAVSVQEQASTTQEIAENVGQASIGMQEVNENINQATLVNKEVTEDISRIQKEGEGVAAASTDIHELAAEMKLNTDGMEKLVQNFKIKKERFDIGQIKAAHFNWKMRLTAVLNGYQFLQVNEIPNHHQCDFGKWYNNAPAELVSLPAFKQIGVHHEAVHAKVSEAVEHFNKNNNTAAEASIQEFEAQRKQLFAKLDELYVSEAAETIIDNKDLSLAN